MIEDTAGRGRLGLSFTDDAVTAAYLAYQGTNPHSIQITDSGRVGFCFDPSKLAEAQADLDSGAAQVDPQKFAAVLRRIIRSYLTKGARKRLRHELQMEEADIDE